MYIKSIELDGFKSYGRRTVVGEFDPHFNAITGFNGSGKSNILDSICFLLGITKMENIRAKNNNDLIHKQGQTGITKASVTITFDNRDKENSPIGYKNYDEIIVRRLLTKDRSQSLINGVTCPTNKASDFFRGIGLNVNNPHFLIMQGRITRVLNMKPDEILGMIEEAAGTKMYDQKRKDSLKTIVSKQTKVDEVTKLLEEHITPQMEKMREDRKNLVEYNQIKKKLEVQQRMLTAFTYHSLIESEADLLRRSENKSKEIEEANAKIVELEENTAALEEKLKELDDKKKEGVDDKSVEAKLKEVVNEGISKESDRDDVASAVKKIEEEIKRQKKTLSGDEKLCEKSVKELEQLQKNANSSSSSGPSDFEEIEKLRKEREALARGLITNEKGESISIESKIQESRTSASSAEASLKSYLIRQNRLQPRIEELKKQLKTKSDRKDNEIHEVDERAKIVEKLEVSLSKLNFNESKDQELRENVTQLKKETRSIAEKMSEIHRRYPRTEFTFADTPGIDKERDVLGVLCTLFSVKDQKYAYAIEIAATTYLTQIVVQSLSVAKLLIEHGKLATRRTFIPVQDTRRRNTNCRPPAEKMAAAEQYASKHGDEVVQAIDLIEYPPELATIMENVFGNILIVKTLKCAKDICYDKRIFMRVVTVDGEDVVPRGTMTGGGADRNRNMLRDMMPFMSWRREFNEKREQLARLEQELQQTEKSSHNFYEMKEKLMHEKAKLESVRDNMANSEIGMIKSELDAAMKDMDSVAKEVADTKLKMADLKKLIADLESRKKNEKDFQAKETKRINAKLAELEKKAERNRESSEESIRLIMTKKADVEELEENIKNTKEAIEELEKELGQKMEELEKKQTNVAKHEAKVKAIRNQLDEMKKSIRQFDDEIKKTSKKIDSQKIEVKKLSASLETMEQEKNGFFSMSQKCKVDAARMKKKNEWIADEMHLFGRKQSEYDFSGYNEDIGKEAVSALEKSKAELERKVNPKINSILDTVEAKVVDLMKKQSQVEKDKEKLLETIKVLDARKKKEIEIAFEAVNKDFGSIFETLLPGAQARLNKVNEKDVLDGVEVKVAFNNQWKDSLQELSGGQRSLVALSLVLAMLKFKPAPLYILDEVDAALDLSHTANIGKMIKTHFTNSQFIIVSLKEGMFNNANVLFRTRFVDGSSEVGRTENIPT